MEHKNQITVKEKKIVEEVKHEGTRDLIRHMGAMLVALSSFLGLLGYQFEWLTPDAINAFLVVAYAAAAFGYTAYEIYKNKFSTAHGQQQNKTLKEKGLKK